MIQLEGHRGRNTQIKTTRAGLPYLLLNLAEPYQDQDGRRTVHWNRCIVWNPDQPELVAAIGAEGDRYRLTGLHKTYSYKTPDGNPASFPYFEVISVRLLSRTPPSRQIH